MKMMSRMFPENRIVEYIASITPRSVRSPKVAPQDDRQQAADGRALGRA